MQTKAVVLLRFISIAKLKTNLSAGFPGNSLTSMRVEVATEISRRPFPKFATLVGRQLGFLCPGRVARVPNCIRGAEILHYL